MKQVKKFISLEYIVDVKNYKQSFDKWMKVCTRFHQVNEQQKVKMFNRYLYVIKPIVHKFTQSTNFHIQLFRNFLPKSMDFIVKSSISNRFKQQGRYQVISNIYSTIKSVLDKNFIDLVSKQQLDPTQFLSLKQNYSILIDKLQKRHQQIYRLKLNQKPVNQEFKWWKNMIEVKPISIQGKVVNGKGQGRKSLGMPTANLEIAQHLHLKMDQYPNGVYFVDFDFINGQKYKGAGCLGTNPHYQNLQQTRKLEVYVLHDFGQRLFYGSQVVVTLKKLIRFQGKFHSFDAFLQAMHNDIYVAHQLCQKNE